MRISAIDIGTNTVLLLVADVYGKSLRPIEHGHAIARLGWGVDEQRNISQEAMDRVGKVLEEYGAISKTQKAERIVACGTSALRDAHNRDAFLEFVRTRFGIDVKILSGKEEARLTYIGALSEFPQATNQHYVVIDIGGGSSEVIAGTESDVNTSVSLDIGCVRLTERFLKNSPPVPHALEECMAMIRDQSISLPAIDSTARLIGVAGTVTTLAALDLNLTQYDPLRVSGHVLSLKTIRHIFDQLRDKSLDELKAVPQIHAGRADIILAGVIILIELMKRMGRDEITVSDRGLRYGFALREAE
ncbi:MAG: Ppx/GppA phosphatase family protein [Bacteroidota bacterium]